MRLSMWMIAERLEKYNPEIWIKNGKCVLNGVRFLSDEQTPNEAYVYIGTVKDFIDVESDAVVCVSGEDMIMLNTEDVNEISNAVISIV